jgi:hypothetical protein
MENSNSKGIKYKALIKLSDGKILLASRDLEDVNVLSIEGLGPDIVEMSVREFEKQYPYYKFIGKIRKD